MSSQPDRLEGRHLIDRLAHRVLGKLGLTLHTQPPVADHALPPAAQEDVDLTRDFVDLTRDLPAGRLAAEQALATRMLFERLTADEVAEIERRIPAELPDLRGHYAKAPSEQVRHTLLLIAGVSLGVPAVLEKTGLTGAQPPEDVHAMARGPLAAAGGLYEANLVADALASAGRDLAHMSGSALDFGCSSGRVVRVLAAAYPDTQWRACDPNGPAIAWARENLAGIEFFINDDEPPLPFADGALDMAYAISIWSHFAPQLGLRWFEEMHRLIRPGGHLVCTTHGLASIAYYWSHEHRSPEQSEEIMRALYRDGAWYAPEFGEDGDWGVVNPEWGTAFLSPEWMLTQLCPRWRILEFAPGRNQHNQDVYVLERV